MADSITREDARRIENELPPDVWDSDKIQRELEKQVHRIENNSEQSRRFAELIEENRPRPESNLEQVARRERRVSVVGPGESGPNRDVVYDSTTGERLGFARDLVLRRSDDGGIEAVDPEGDSVVGKVATADEVRQYEDRFGDVE